MFFIYYFGSIIDHAITARTRVIIHKWFNGLFFSLFAFVPIYWSYTCTRLWNIHSTLAYALPHFNSAKPSTSKNSVFLITFLTNIRLFYFSSFFFKLHILLRITKVLFTFSHFCLFSFIPIIRDCGYISLILLQIQILYHFLWSITSNHC